jgi:hypothetical protein
MFSGSNTIAQESILSTPSAAFGAPQVGHAIGIARVVAFELFEQRRVEVVPVAQLGLVQFLECAGTDLLAEEMVGGHHHVVAAAPGEQLALEGFVGIEDVVDGLDASLLLECLEGVFADVIRPVVDMYGGSLGAGGSGQRDGGNQRLEGRAHGKVLFVTGRALPRGERPAVYCKNL